MKAAGVEALVIDIDLAQPGAAQAVVDQASAAFGYLQQWAPPNNMTVKEARAKFPKETGIARYGEPEEIAELMAFLVSPGARWMTGSTLRRGGGELKSV